MLALVNASLIDGTGAAPRQGERVLTDGKKIAAIGRYINIPEGAEIIDLCGKTLMPGLIEAHAHLGDHPFRDGAGIKSAAMTDNYAKMRELTLAAGVTTIRSCGDYMYDTASVRDKTNNGELTGPRIITSGKTFMRKDGHPAVTVWAADRATVDNCGAYPNTPEEARVMVREAAAAKMDFIKIIISNTHLIYWPEKKEPLSREIIAAITDEAHSNNLTVACHVDDLDQANLAFDCGADELHHLVAIGSPRYELTEYAKLFAKMCEKNVYMVPTLAAPRVSESARINKGCFDGGIDYNINALRLAYEFGVPFGLGCDSGCPGVPWGKCIADEAAEYVYNLGMTPLETIKCATSNNARMFGMETQIGAVRVGAFADLLALDKNPAENIGNLHSVHMVIRDGRIVTDNR